MADLIPTSPESRERMVEALRAAKEYAESIVETIHEPLLVLTPELRVRSANPAFFSDFQVRPEETVGRLVYELGNGQWNIPALRTLLEDVLPENHTFKDFEVRHDFEDIGERIMLVNARRLDHVQLILLGIRDITERKRAEEAVRASEARLRLITDGVPALISYIDAGLRYRFANRYYQEWFGRSPEEVLGKHLREFLGDAAFECLRPHAEAALAGRRESFEAEIPFQEGGTRHVRSAFVPDIGPDGSVAGYYALDTDVTARARAEQAVRESGERHAFVLRLNDALRPLADPAEIQAVALRLLVERMGANRGISLEVEGEGDTARAVVRGQHAREVSRLPDRVAASPFVTGLPAELLQRSGTLVVPDTARDPRMSDEVRAAWLGAEVAAAVAVPLVKHGQVVASLGVHQAAPREWTPSDVQLVEEVADRTWAAVERARAEAALRESEERFRLFGDASSDVLWIRGTERLQWEYLSRAFETIYGYARSEVMGKDDLGHWADLIVPEDRERALAAVERVRGGERVTFEFRIRRADGEVRWLRNTDFPIRDEGGHVRHIGGIGQDVTEQKRADAALKRLNETLEQRVEERTAALTRAVEVRRQVLQQLVSAEEEERRRISRELHDHFGQQVTGLLLGLYALESETSATDRLRDLQRLADRIARDLQSMAVELRPPALDSLGLVAALRGHLEEWSGRHRIEADLHTSGFDGVRLPREEETTLYRVAQEGLTNVVKHAGASRVSLVLERRRGVVRLILEDDGRGFDVEQVGALPEKAKRLGLRGMRERIALLGGELEIESSPGIGTSLYVRLPDSAQVPAGVPAEGEGEP